MMGGFVELVSMLLEIPLENERNALYNFMVSPHVGFRFCQDNRTILTYPPWWKGKIQTLEIPIPQQTTVDQQSLFSKIPREIALKIVALLPLRDKKTCRILEKDMRHLLDNNLLTQTYRSRTLSVADQLDILKNLPTVETLIITVAESPCLEALCQLPSNIKALTITTQRIPVLQRCWTDTITTVIHKCIGPIPTHCTIPPEAFSQLLHLSLQSNEANLSLASNLTQLSLTSSNGQQVDNVLSSVPHPEKILDISILTETTESRSSSALDRFTNVKKLHLSRYNSSTTFRCIESIHVSLGYAPEFRSSPIQKAKFESVLQLPQCLSMLPSSITHLSINSDDYATSSQFGPLALPSLVRLEAPESLLPIFSRMPSIQILETDHFHQRKDISDLIPPNCDTLITWTQKHHLCLPSRIKTWCTYEWLRTPGPLPNEPSPDLNVIYQLCEWPRHQQLKEARRVKMKYKCPHFDSQTLHLNFTGLSPSLAPHSRGP
eukprot:TRINITY_DN19186_c0_g1_i1.p1 TRINITY_DN19186_c0_g1~~TRINITY_DN19186_c0_g1_i1.p1  ORF type:complete len:491 (-),score=18.49 TRINITY_DN19186_c0_g1_i1:74-1546(-)